MDFKAYYENQQKLVENFLKNRIAKKGISSRLENIFLRIKSSATNF